MQAEPVADFYVDAVNAINAGVMLQDLEDDIDLLMAEEDELLEDLEMEEVLADDDESVARQQVDVAPSEFTEFAIKIPTAGDVANFSFEERRYLRPIYDTAAHRVLMKCARQVEKSTLLGNKALAYSGLNLAFKTLYVSATATQAQVFSVDRIKEPIEISEELGFMIDKRLSQNVLFKQFRNRSQIRMRYAFLSADRVRGIPADQILIDEVQDIIYANIPVIEQCASHSEWKLYTYSGTPKSLDNTIEKYWTDFSTQNEWVVPCDRHGTPKRPDTWHWNVLGMKNIGKKGLVCAKCKKPIDPMHPMAQWASLQPVTEANSHLVTFEGYRIPQLMVPWINWNDDIIMNLERYDTARFNNEVLGLSYDSGQRPLTRAQVRAVCKKDIHLHEVIENARKYLGGVFAGIDWGCHDDQTRVLTDSGFKYFADLTDDDLVAQFDKDTRAMSFVKPEARTVREWDKPLYHLSGKGVDMMLTGTHRMLVDPHGTGDWVVEPMERFATRRSSSKIRGYVEWEGEELRCFFLPGLPSSPGYKGCHTLGIEGDLWLELLGYLLSEGGLCFNKGRPSCVKMSQRVVDGDTYRVDKIRGVLELSGLKFSEFPNKKTGDINWTIYGKQLWHWWSENIGRSGDTKRVPRQFLNLSKRQLRILFDAMMLGDGSDDKRGGNENGGYSSTSLGLCEDFQELCIRLGLKSVCGLHKPAKGNRKARYRTSWSRTRDLSLNYAAMERIERVPYSGKVYCCKVPSGFIVTERNGCISYQGNTGEEDSFTVIALGGYMGSGFQIFYVHRFTGEDLDPRTQLEKIAKLLTAAQFTVIGADYGGGYYPNDWLQRNFGTLKLAKYQYAGTPKAKVKWSPKLGRFILHRTEIMSDIFNALKRKQIWLPRWPDINTPYAEDMLNIFSEYNRQINMLQYKLSPGKSDDTFHAVLYCFLVSMLVKPRPDIIIPLKEGTVDFSRPGM